METRHGGKYRENATSPAGSKLNQNVALHRQGEEDAPAADPGRTGPAVNGRQSPRRGSPGSELSQHCNHSHDSALGLVCDLCQACEFCNVLRAKLICEQCDLVLCRSCHKSVNESGNNRTHVERCHPVLPLAHGSSVEETKKWDLIHKTMSERARRRLYSRKPSAPVMDDGMNGVDLQALLLDALRQDEGELLLEEKLREERAVNKEMEEDLQQIRRGVALKDERIDFLESREALWNETNARAVQLQADKEALEKVVDDLRDQLQNMEGRYLQSKQTNERLEAELDSRATESMMLKERALEADQAARQREAEFIRQLKEGEKENIQQQAEIYRLQEENRNAHQRMEVLESQLAEAQDAQGLLQNRLQSTQGRENSLSQKVVALSQQLEAMARDREIEARDRENTELRMAQEFEDQKRVLLNKMRDLENQLSASTAYANSIQQARDALQADFNSLQNNSQAERDALQGKLMLQRQQTEAAERDARNKLKELRRVGGEREQAEKERDEIHRLHEEVTGRAEELANKHLEERRRAENLQLQRQETETINQKLKTAAEQLKGERDYLYGEIYLKEVNRAVEKNRLETKLTQALTRQTPEEIAGIHLESKVPMALLQGGAGPTPAVNGMYPGLAPNQQLIDVGPSIQTSSGIEPSTPPRGHLDRGTLQQTQPAANSLLTPARGTMPIPYVETPGSVGIQGPLQTPVRANDIKAFVTNPAGKVEEIVKAFPVLTPGANLNTSGGSGPALSAYTGIPSGDRGSPLSPARSVVATTPLIDGRHSPARKAAPLPISFRPSPPVARQSGPALLRVPLQFDTVEKAVEQACSGDSIEVSPGVYQVSSPLIFSQDINIVGTGQSSTETILEGTNFTVIYVVAPKVSVSNLCVRQASGGAGGNSVCLDLDSGTEATVTGCSFSSQSLACIAVHREASPTIEDCTFTDMATYGCFMYDSARGQISGCSFRSYGEAAIKVKRGSNPTISNTDIDGGGRGKVGVDYSKESAGLCTDNSIRGNTLAGVYIQSLSNPTIKKNKIQHNQGVGIGVQDQGRGILEENDIASNDVAGIGVKKGGEPVARGNIISKGGAGVSISEDGRGTFEGNEIRDCTKSSVAVKSRANPTFVGNRIERGKSSGVYVYDKGAGVFEDNDVVLNVGAGFCVTANATPVVRGNRIRENKKEGIVVTTGGLGEYENNTISENGWPGVTVESKARPIVRGNQICNGRDAGVYILDGGAGLFENNEIHDNRNAGIAMMNNGKDVMIKGNVIRDGRECGIFAYKGARGVIQENEFRNNAKSAVAVRDEGTEIVVKGNRILGTSSYGIFVYEKGAATITDNTIEDCGKASICVATEADPIVKSNVIRRGKDVGVFIFNRGRGRIEENDISGHAKGEVAIETRGDPLVRRNEIHGSPAAGVRVDEEGLGVITLNWISGCSVDVAIQEGAMVTCEDNLNVARSGLDE